MQGTTASARWKERERERETERESFDPKFFLSPFSLSLFLDLRCKEGDPVAFLPLLHYALLAYSRPLNLLLASRGYELYGKSDLRFIEGAYRVRETKLITLYYLPI